MNDIEYLEQIVATCTKLDELMATFKFEIKSTDGTLLYRSKIFQQGSGKERDDTENKNLPPDLGRYNKSSSIAEELEVVLKKVVKHAININSLDGQIQPYLTSKFPIVNPLSGNVVGTFIMIQKLLFNSVQHQILRALEIYDEPATNNFEKYKLTKREKQLIFLFIGGLSSKEIALILSKLEGRDISKNTIDNIFSNQLRVKFDAYSRESLYDKLLELGFDRMVPQDLLVGVKIPLNVLEVY